jgi:SAM-dependent methyltransferase
LTQPWVAKPARRPGDPPLFLRELIAAAPSGGRVLDAGCGPGSWPYAERADLRITAFDVKFPPGPPAPAPHVTVFRGDLARLPLKSDTFDLTVCHYVLEHVTELDPCCDELARVTRQGGTLYLSVPRSASFDDRFYRFAGYFAKYALGKFQKQLEHQQHFDLEKALGLFEARGFEAQALARVPAGFSWMNDPRTKQLQGPFTEALAVLHRGAGVDLAADANLVLTFTKTGAIGVRRAPRERRVTHVCRDCGEHAVVTAPSPWPQWWDCPWCGMSNPFGKPR